MEYKELSKIFYMDSSHERDANLEKLADERKNSPFSFRLGYSTKAGELFLSVPPDLQILNERVLRRERRISNLMQSFPPLVSDGVLRGLVFDEVISSNNIENIHSTRQQIEDALNADVNDDPNKRRFKEFAQIYLDLLTGASEIPKTPEDIRVIYDKVMEGEKIEHPLDGVLFRKGSVFIGDGSKTIHSGVVPESEIYKAMEACLSLVNSQDIPSIYSALASHYIFEYAHPFYDGNGRTGRYLLSLFLDEPLSKATALSLSRAIFLNKGKYYKAFQVADDPLNKGELTFFVQDILELIFQSQEELMLRLESNIDRLNTLANYMNDEDIKDEFNDREIALIFALSQQLLFGMRLDTPLQNLSSYMQLSDQQTRFHLSKLEEKGVVERVRKRSPITFKLTDEFKRKHLSDVFDE